ncbi:hypothetical protein CLV98_101219 [Dyadobacter jejuensis]|uniref:Uncharacterized protein n=1 Tax=Dyadobacter jejuensis TaxID=1082580 RepID=A0A316AS00_9BACT|nr:hypothetical protein CLV98_101219 [Dyadobacter jejuensis]
MLVGDGKTVGERIEQGAFLGKDKGSLLAVAVLAGINRNSPVYFLTFAKLWCPQPLHGDRA